VKTKTLFEFLVPLSALLVATVFFRLTDADLATEAMFYSREEGWFLADSALFVFLYHHGNVPAFLMAGGALCYLGYAQLSGRDGRRRKAALFVALYLAVGPGLIVNAALKPNWGRPRPKQVTQFGGEHAFLPVWAKGTCGNCASFPSGHASIGYFVMAPYFVFRRTFPRLAVGFLMLGLSYGTLMGFARMAQGAHFPSDVLWSAGFVYLTGLTLHYPSGLHLPPSSGDKPAQNKEDDTHAVDSL
jgi:membrane-associated PAP2 superfamily phosphatase